MRIAGTKLTDENLDEFLDYLGEYGLPAGPGERVRAHRLLATSGRGRTLEQWKYALCPVFARDAVEQSTAATQAASSLGRPGCFQDRVDPLGRGG